MAQILRAHWVDNRQNTSCEWTGFGRPVSAVFLIQLKNSKCAEREINLLSAPLTAIDYL